MTFRRYTAGKGFQMTRWINIDFLAGYFFALLTMWLRGKWKERPDAA